MIAKMCIVVALIALIIYMYGVLITITTQEKNTCEMTYMFEYPQFVVSNLVIIFVRLRGSRIRFFSGTVDFRKKQKCVIHSFLKKDLSYDWSHFWRIRKLFL